ncbi:MAG: hypothetical protein PUC66_01960 [Erysipelotrichaceae bacterium]|nr:hypothetical protein [Erysipelotrichaceae bacterium]
MPVIDMLSYVNSELSSHRQQGEEKGQDQKYLPFFQKECHYQVTCFYPIYSNSTDGHEPRPLGIPGGWPFPLTGIRPAPTDDNQGDPSCHRFFSA